MTTPSDRLADVDDPLPAQRAAAAQRLREVLAVEVLHHQVEAAVVEFAEVEDLDDVLVVDRRGRARLLDEAAGDRRVAAAALGRIDSSILLPGSPPLPHRDVTGPLVRR